ncbi:hypothetical protein RvY_13939-2 [Ramazzottius varieornatus]|uniref:Meckel syndrome type 1 protein n=1 Tax=Ramazzottius varieornatus TaxID=947166 RepID=A0A1D1VX01_RAMVA|nr:hypothetical protein RvY_13939-2 [Ramazzottius varieornatus]
MVFAKLGTMDPVESGASFQAEQVLYKDLKNCDTPRKKAIHQVVIAITDAERQFHDGPLYTWVDADVSSEMNALTPLTDDENVTETHLGTDAAPYRPRRPRIEDLSSQNNQREVFRLMSPRHNVARATTAMFIMVNLTDTNAPKPSKDNGIRVLCKMQVDSEGLLAVQPDFNASRSPYVIDVSRPGKVAEKYEYHLEHASENMARMDLEKEKQLFRALYQRYSNHQAVLVGNDFDMPKDGYTRLYYSGEIVDADGFDHDDLFVHFLLEIPSGWTSEWGSSGDKEPAHFSSQIAQRRKAGRHFFGCPFGWNMEYSAESHLPTDSNYRLDWPRLLFEVVSLDAWNRYRVEGYGFLDVLSAVGSAVETVHTWIPIGEGSNAKLRRYLVGGGAELENLNYVTVPRDFKAKEFSRYGFRTAGAGRLRVRHTLIVQRGISTNGQNKLSYISSRYHRGFRGDPQRASMATFDQAVERVLEAFKRARRRLLEARGILNVD